MKFECLSLLPPFVVIRILSATILTSYFNKYTGAFSRSLWRPNNREFLIILETADPLQPLTATRLSSLVFYNMNSTRPDASKSACLGV